MMWSLKIVLFLPSAKDKLLNYLVFFIFYTACQLVGWWACRTTDPNPVP